ncbi:MAG: tRNA (adenosine(37)-N6)-threonylcarbamoyltransferase complex ATPase subunit type 1 TsaE [candidate division GAL15 bacterium]
MTARTRQWISTSEAQTRQLGEALGRVLRSKDAVALTGQLGAGKTTFVQGVARGLGVRGYVASPTFPLVREYAGRLLLYHVDLFRIGPEDLDSIGFDELVDSRAAVVVEWADRAARRMPEDCLWVHLVGTGQQPRAIRVEAAGPVSEELLRRWEQEVEAERAGVGG